MILILVLMFTLIMNVNPFLITQGYHQIIIPFWVGNPESSDMKHYIPLCRGENHTIKSHIQAWHCATVTQCGLTTHWANNVNSETATANVNNIIATLTNKNNQEITKLFLESNIRRL